MNRARQLCLDTGDLTFDLADLRLVAEHGGFENIAVFDHGDRIFQHRRMMSSRVDESSLLFVESGYLCKCLAVGTGPFPGHPHRLAVLRNHGAGGGMVLPAL